MMAFCKHRDMDKCGKDNRPCIFSEDCFDPEERKPLTNADRIRAMSDEDLAWELMLWRCEAVAKHHGVSSEYPDTQKTILEWLQKPTEVE